MSHSNFLGFENKAFVGTTVMAFEKGNFFNERDSTTVTRLPTLAEMGIRMSIEQFDRMTSVAEAAVTLDNKIVSQTDHSASYRILPILNTIHNLDLTQKEHWFGYGIDAGHNNMSERMIVTDYGFWAYFLGLCLVFSCAIRFWSLPTLMFFIGVGGGTGNIAYQWGILMVFMSVKYFYERCRIIKKYD